MATYFFRVNMSYAECEDLYRPGNNSALMTAESGHRVQLPTANLRPFVSRIGLKGRFRLVTDTNNKLQSFEKVS